VIYVPTRDTLPIREFITELTRGGGINHTTASTQAGILREEHKTLLAWGLWRW